MGFSRQEYWSGLPFPSPGGLHNPETEPCLLCFLHWQAGSLPLTPSGEPQKYQLGWNYELQTHRTSPNNFLL